MSGVEGELAVVVGDAIDTAVVSGFGAGVENVRVSGDEITVDFHGRPFTVVVIAR